MARLLAVLATTGATCVLSSTWRVDPETVAWYRAAGLPIADVTPVLATTGHRGDEITAWLLAHPAVARYAIVDDDPDAGDGPLVRPHFVQTQATVGLTDGQAHALVALLGTKA